MGKKKNQNQAKTHVTKKTHKSKRTKSRRKSEQFNNKFKTQKHRD